MRRVKSATANAHAERNITRGSMMRDRPNSEVSRNCLKKRDVRARKRMLAKGELNSTRYGTTAGEKQFGSDAKAYHLAQRIMQQPVAMTEAHVKKLHGESTDAVKSCWIVSKLTGNNRVELLRLGDWKRTVQERANAHKRLGMLKLDTASILTGGEK
jgi:hypothetical protein